MVNYPAQAVTFVDGYVPPTHGAAPWLDAADGSASWIEYDVTAHYIARVEFGDVPAAATFSLDIQASKTGGEVGAGGSDVLRVAWTLDALGLPGVDFGDPVPGVSADIDLQYAVGAAWTLFRVEVPLSHDGGPLTLLARTKFGEPSLSYMAVVGSDRPPPRRIFPRDDGLMGGAPRVFPPSKGYQSGNRAAGGYV